MASIVIPGSSSGIDFSVVYYGTTTSSQLVEIIESSKPIFVKFTPDNIDLEGDLYYSANVYQYENNLNDSNPSFTASLVSIFSDNQIIEFILNGDTWTNVVTDLIDTSDTYKATDTTLGTIKVNSSDGIVLNSNNQLTVNGRLGQLSGSTGIFSPKSINPTAVGNGSFLITEASGTTIGPKSLSVTTGMNLTLNTSHAAGSTSYTVKNSYVNRILCTIALKGRACLNEASSNSTVPITSITVGGSEISPSSTDSSTPIVITTSGSANPSNSTSQIRIYPDQRGFSNLLFGVSRTGDGYGYSVVGGQQVGNVSNASAVFGNTQYNTGNSSLIAGRQHINTKQNAFLAGIGHDTTNGTTEIVALGKWSDVKSNTALAFGGGTSNTSRSNILEITTAGDATFREDVNIGRDLVVTGTTSLSGTATAPTPSSGDDSTKIATTAFVWNALDTVPSITYGDTDLTAGTSQLASGTFYAYYE